MKATKAVKLTALLILLAWMPAAAHATWGKFPPKDAGRGEVRVGTNYGDYGLYTSNIFDFDARYSIIRGLEASVVLPVCWRYLSYSSTNTSGDESSSVEVTNILLYTKIGARYWCPIGLGIFSNLSLPIHTPEDITDIAYLANLEVGAQYSINIAEKLSFGSQLGVIFPFENDWGYTPGMELDVGVELDYSIGRVTPFLGIDMLFGLTKPTHVDANFNKFEGNGGHRNIELSAGVKLDITKMFSADVYFRYGNETWHGNDANLSTTHIGGRISLNF